MVVVKIEIGEVDVVPMLEVEIVDVVVNSVGSNSSAFIICELEKLIILLLSVILKTFKKLSSAAQTKSPVDNIFITLIGAECV